MRELCLEARRTNLSKVQGFVDELLDGYEYDQNQYIVLQICIEEIFVNIADYAYKGAVGEATIRAEVTEEDGRPVLTMTFIDRGMPFNPLKKKDPDITLPGEQRPIGGLGIYMVKDRMDDVTYEYKDGCNILTIMEKLLSPKGRR
ncbi:MAG: ATP-binding protein [Lachnospiraceae bacterium]|nr:ATP-binding protein [Lachnospiraceae bacterium]